MPRRFWIALLALLALLAPSAALRAEQTAPRSTPADATPSLFLPLVSAAPPALRSVHLVKDIATRPQANGSNPSDFAVAGNALYVVAEAGTHGRELWRYDGTRATQLTSFSPHKFSTTITHVTVVGNTVVFVLNTSEVWSMDRTSLSTAKLATFGARGGADLDVREFTVVNGVLFFIGYSSQDGDQVWRTDGTRAGTIPLTTLPSTGSSLPADFTAGNGVLFFTADDNVHGRELWKSDGTAAGTLPFTDLSTDTLTASIESPTMFNGALYFVASTQDRALWRSDGTPGGTVRVAAIATEPYLTGALLAAGDTTLFVATPTDTSTLLLAYDGTTTRELTDLSTYKTVQRMMAVNDSLYALVHGDGSALLRMTATTTTTTELHHSFASLDDLVVFDHRLFFTDYSDNPTNPGGIWATDGTITGTVRVSEQQPSSRAPNLVPFGASLFFSGSAPATGVELWKTDGTPVGTVPVLNINPDVASSNPMEGYPLTSGLVFHAHTDDGQDTQMYSDGTPAGTQPLAQIQPGGENKQGYGPYLFGDALLFIADDGVHGSELWRTDQTLHNQQLLRDIHPGPAGSSIQAMGSIGAHFYFSANDGTTGQELWITDGTASGTKQLKDIRSGPADSYPRYVDILGDTLLFTAYEPGDNGGLWVTDGTATHTARVATFRVDDDTSDTGLTWLGQRGKNAFFRVDASPHALWKTDATAKGTQQVSDVTILDTDDGPAVLDTDGTYFYFLGEKAGKAGLWRSDGTSSGTMFLLDVLRHSSYGFALNWMSFGNKLCFLFDDGTQGYELWGTDGTPQSTKRLHNGVVASTSQDIGELAATDKLLLFVAPTPGTDLEKTLWRTDGTVAGTYAVLATTAQTDDPVINNLHPVGTSVFFTAGNAGTPESLWRSDGTVAGTQPILGVWPTMFSIDEDHSESPLVGDTLYFTANDAAHGTELWRADGATSEAQLVRDVCAGVCDAAITNLTRVGNNVIFAANDGVHGNEVWRSDGTAGGTALVDDIAPGADDADPGPFWVADGQVFFSAYGPDVGRELWALSAPGALAATSRVATHTVAVRNQATTRRHVLHSSQGATH